jgi:RES domain-containing protein
MVESTWFKVSSHKKITDLIDLMTVTFPAGRWNLKGRAVMYWSSSTSLSFVESHSNFNRGCFDRSLYRHELVIPANLVRPFRSFQLPKNWNRPIATDDTRLFVEQELFEKNRIALAVPSLLIPSETNLLLNLDHTMSRTLLAKVFSCSIGKL